MATGKSTKQLNPVVKILLGVVTLGSLWLFHAQVIDGQREPGAPKDRVARQTVQRYLAAEHRGHTRQGCVLARQAAGAWSQAGNQVMHDRWKRIGRESCYGTVAAR